MFNGVFNNGVFQALCVLKRHVAMTRPSLVRGTKYRIQEELLVIFIVNNSYDDGVSIPTMNHHVPGVPIETVSPVIVALRNETIIKVLKGHKYYSFSLCKIDEHLATVAPDVKRRCG